MKGLELLELYIYMNQDASKHSRRYTFHKGPMKIIQIRIQRNSG